MWLTIKTGLTVSSTVDELLASDCTSCEIAQDKSAYWTPQLYFMASDGSVELVPETNGHLTFVTTKPAISCFVSLTALDITNMFLQRLLMEFSLNRKQFPTV